MKSGLKCRAALENLKVLLCSPCILSFATLSYRC